MAMWVRVSGCVGACLRACLSVWSAWWRRGWGACGCEGCMTVCDAPGGFERGGKAPSRCDLPRGAGRDVKTPAKWITCTSCFAAVFVKRIEGVSCVCCYVR